MGYLGIVLSYSRNCALLVWQEMVESRRSALISASADLVVSRWGVAVLI